VKQGAFLEFFSGGGVYPRDGFAIGKGYAGGLKMSNQLPLNLT